MIAKIAFGEAIRRYLLSIDISTYLEPTIQRSNDLPAWQEKMEKEAEETKEGWPRTLLFTLGLDMYDVSRTTVI